MQALLLILDLVALLSALFAAWLWYRASRRQTRRVEQTEKLDFHDFNRLVVAFNRASILNRRAAIATAISALCLAAKLAADFVADLL